MRRTTTMAAAAALLAVTAAACGSDDGGGSTYRVTRDGEEVVIRDTRPPSTTTPNTIVLPTFPTPSTNPDTTTSTDPDPDTTTSTDPDTTTSTGAPASTLPAAAGVTITDTWLEPDDSGEYDWGVIYESSAPTPTAYAPVVARFLDADGTTLDTAEATIELLLPGAGAYADRAVNIAGAVESIEVTIGEGPTTEFEAVGELTADQVVYDDAIEAVTGQITSSYPTDLADVTINAVWRDEAGEVASMTRQRTRLVEAETTSWFVIDLLFDVTTAPTELYLTPRPSAYSFQPVDPAVSITDQWFFDDGGSAIGYAWGAILTNTGEQVWDGMLVTARFYDADGILVAADDTYQYAGRADDTAVTGRVWTVPTAIASMEVEILDGGSEGRIEEGTITISDVASAPAADLPTVTATATSTFAEAVDSVQVVFVWRDAEGKIVYALEAYSDEIAANGSGAVEATLYGSNAPTTPPTDVYWAV